MAWLDINRGNTFLFRFSQKHSSLGLKPLKGFLSWPGKTWICTRKLHWRLYLVLTAFRSSAGPPVASRNDSEAGQSPTPSTATTATIVSTATAANFPIPPPANSRQKSMDQQQASGGALDQNLEFLLKHHNQAQPTASVGHTGLQVRIRSFFILIQYYITKGSIVRMRLY